MGMLRCLRGSICGHEGVVLIRLTKWRCSGPSKASHKLLPQFVRLFSRPLIAGVGLHGQTRTE